MKVTYLMGNGFDVNLGLPTKYSDFYQEYLDGIRDLDLSKPDNLMIKEFWDKIKDEVFDKWKDFEEALAFNLEGDEKNVSAVLSHFTNKFSVYLKRVSNRFECTDEVTDSFISFLENGCDTLIKRDKNILSSYQIGAPTNFEIRFINFNYTDSIEKIIDNYKSRHNSLSIYEISRANTSYSAFINKEVLHLHGSLNQNDFVIIGIDSIEQFANDKLKTNPKAEKYCVKSKTNQTAGYSDRESDYVSWVNSSDIIYTYGISFSKTDKYRWDIIKKWLEASASHRFVVYEYNSGIKEHISAYVQDTLDYIDNHKKEIMKHIGIEETDYEKYSEQVFVIDSADVLNCKFSLKTTVHA